MYSFKHHTMFFFTQVSGEAQEVLSLRQCPIRFLQVLPTPHTAHDKQDAFALKRPLAAVCDAARYNTSHEHP